MHEANRRGDRVYLAYGTGAGGVLQILDRNKLLNDIDDPVSPSRENLLSAQVGRIDLPSYWGGHTAFPLIGMRIPEYSHYGDKTRDFVILISETYSHGCNEDMHHMAWFLDITEPERPWPVANYHVREEDGNFCSRGGRFGMHSMNWSQTAPFYGKVAVFSYFNAGARAVDVRNPYRPKEIGYYIPAAEANNGVAHTNNVEVDDRGYIYLVDRASTGLHIVELTGAARKILGLR
jgi:hypothetical protein